MRNVNLNFLPHPKTTEMKCSCCPTFNTWQEKISFWKLSTWVSKYISAQRPISKIFLWSIRQTQKRGKSKKQPCTSNPSQNTVFYIRHEIKANTLRECPIKSKAKIVSTSEKAFCWFLCVSLSVINCYSDSDSSYVLKDRYCLPEASDRPSQKPPLAFLFDTFFSLFKMFPGNTGEGSRQTDRQRRKQFFFLT